MPDNKPQLDKFKEAAREAECDTDEKAFDQALGKISKPKKICPECRRIFRGNGWDGIDAHWRSKHEDIMPYEEAWPLLKSGNYKVKN